MSLSSKKIIITLLLILGKHIINAQQKDNNQKCRYTKTANGYLMVMREGDNVLALIESLVSEQQIPSANFTGIGFAQEVTFGFYDFSQKKFNPKTFNKVEMGSLTGSIAWSGGKPSLHIHGVATDDKFDAYGGHILALKVGTGSMEVYITINNEKLERKIEQPLNANVLQLPCLN
ncbi:putative DNA-binding protein with PD1-like motif [Flavobacterium sp. HSC-32F16]|uniref:PPC domain-containing DNA-binding protein n=1 Tax=Flavobacterium sp. HSC-32F16 TaxID=2910964 RepID=UPI0020A60EB3|nr:PPC domain-containing DNA-binding protein [Flavobacterium sp. HSC-32F16]MCP2025336.1 putative DNA-binding protein with PD1-like motif [Flavobacterium sp. HSC-32F16]